MMSNKVVFPEPFLPTTHEIETFILEIELMVYKSILNLLFHDFISSLCGG